MIKTDIGECIYINMKKCCEKLGYEYLDIRNIGTNDLNFVDNIKTTNQSFILIAIAITISISFLIYNLRKKF